MRFLVSEENFYHYETSGAEALLWVVFANSTGLPCWSDQCRQQAQEHQKSLRSVARDFPQIKVVFVDAAAHKDYIVGSLGLQHFPALVLQKGTMSVMDAPLKTFALRFEAELPMLDVIKSWIQQVLDTSKE